MASGDGANVGLSLQANSKLRKLASGTRLPLSPTSADADQLLPPSLGADGGEKPLSVRHKPDGINFGENSIDSASENDDGESLRSAEDAGGDVEEMDQDFEFIREVLSTHAEEFNQKESVVEQIKEIIKKGKRKTTEEMRETTIQEVTALETNFRKILGIACKTSLTLFLFC